MRIGTLLQFFQLVWNIYQAGKGDLDSTVFYISFTLVLPVPVFDSFDSFFRVFITIRNCFKFI